MRVSVPDELRPKMKGSSALAQALRALDALPDAPTDLACEAAEDSAVRAQRSRCGVLWAATGRSGSGSNDFDRIFGDAINQSVTSVDRRDQKPVYRSEEAQAADPLVSVALDIRNEGVDALEGLAILELPPDIVVQACGVHKTLSIVSSPRQDVDEVVLFEVAVSQLCDRFAQVAGVRGDRRGRRSP